MAGLPSATLRCIFYGRSKNPGTRTLLDICQALEITLYDFFNGPLFQTQELEGSYSSALFLRRKYRETTKKTYKN